MEDAVVGDLFQRHQFPLAHDSVLFRSIYHPKIPYNTSVQYMEAFDALGLFDDSRDI